MRSGVRSPYAPPIIQGRIYSDPFYFEKKRDFMTRKVAVSACLLGVPCRYDGGSKPNEEVIQYLNNNDCEVVRICPEVMGGLSIPHPANEIQMRKGKRIVCDKEGNDNTKAFEEGARIACERACKKGCTHAILKAKSPSCGVGKIYDGTFTGSLVSGDGVAAQLLREAGLIVADEHTFREVFSVSDALRDKSVSDQ